MLTLRDLKLIVNSDKLKLVVTGIEELLNNGWIRDKQKETDWLSHAGIEFYCFTCSQTNERRACNLFLSTGEDGYLHVTTIMPGDGSSLSYSEYNHVLEEFHQLFLMPVGQKLDIRIVFPEAERSINNSMSPELATLLHTFSNAANKSSGASHPLDEKRWYAFLVAAHQEKSLLDVPTLRQLLEEDGWGEEEALELSTNYESARSLLRYYEEATADAGS